MNLRVEDYSSNKAQIRVYWDVGPYKGWIDVTPETTIIGVVNNISRKVAARLLEDDK